MNNGEYCVVTSYRSQFLKPRSLSHSRIVFVILSVLAISMRNLMNRNHLGSHPLLSNLIFMHLLCLLNNTVPNLVICVTFFFRFNDRKISLFCVMSKECGDYRRTDVKKFVVNRERRIGI